MNCLNCAKKLSKPFLKLGNIPLANTLADEHHEAKSFPLELIFCNNCKLVQLTHIVAPEILYKDYVYLSSYSTSFQNHCRKYVRDLDKQFGIGINSNVLEIASNDGCLLQYVKPYGAKILGVEPAINIADIANTAGVPTLNVFFNSESAKSIVAGFGHADFIIGNNVLAHVSAINDFMRALKHCLGTEGVAVFEVPYLLNLIHNVEFDTIYHEHIFYYSIHSLNNLFERHGLEIFDVKAQSIHGGSIRIFVQHSGQRSVNSIVSYYEFMERMYDMDKDLGYQHFAAAVIGFKQKFKGLLEQLASMNKTIAAYGAPAKATTLLNYCGINNKLIDFTVDLNTRKQGMMIPGTSIPILAPEELVNRNPDYTVILPWNFADEIQGQQQEYVKRGGKFIIPSEMLKIHEVEV